MPESIAQAPESVRAEHIDDVPAADIVYAMKRKLRSNLDEGSVPWSGRRAQWRALGLTDEDMQKPKIAIVNSSSELSSCFSHLDGLADELKVAIRAAGGVPFEIRTAAPCDFITSAGKRGAYILPTRDLIAADIEVQVEGALLDGMVCLASCDKTTPGQLMAAGRLNIPTIVVVCGYQKAGSYRGQHTDIEDVFLKTGYLTSGAVTIEEVKGMADVAIQSPGVCQGMGTANSMHVVCEALGMTLPGSAPVAAGSAKMHADLRAAGARIVEMVWQDLKPRDVITAGAVRNAVQMVLAVSGSINCVKHLQAIATEAEVDIDVYQTFADYAERVPLLAAVKPTGHGHIEDFEAAGGARGVLKRLERQLDLDARSVSGETLREILAATTVVDERMIATLDKPLSTRPAIVIVRGSLLPGGGIVRLGGTGERMLVVQGQSEHLPFARRGAGRHQSRPSESRRRRRAARSRRHRRPRHGDDVGRHLRARRRGPARQGRRDHRRPALGARQQRLGRRRSLAGSRGRRPARVTSRTATSSRSTCAARPSTSRCRKRARRAPQDGAQLRRARSARLARRVSTHGRARARRRRAQALRAPALTRSYFTSATTRASTSSCRAPYARRQGAQRGTSG